MKVLILSINDYACFGHDQANALRSVGIECRDLTLNPHLFNYPSQSEVVTIDQMKQVIPLYDIVMIMHSSSDLLGLVLSVKHGRIIHFATGTTYRQDFPRLNKIFNPHVERSFIALGEFAGLGSKNETYCVGAIDTDRIKPTNPYKSGTVKIGHFPSNPEVKGTDKIRDMVSKLTGDFEFICDENQVDYQKQLERMQECDIILELFAPEQGGKPYGSWGITALEAAAMGKIVFTQLIHDKIYKDTYGEWPEMEMLHDEERWIKTLQYYINSPELVGMNQIQSRQWVTKHHSYQATGLRLKKILNI